MDKDNPKKLLCGHFNLIKGCKHCSSLFAKWNKKLAKDLGEIEDYNVPGTPLKAWDNLKFRGMNQEVLESKRMYFEACSNLLMSYKWDNPIHKEIWKLHSEGLSVREIADTIDKKKLKKSNIAYIINHYKKDLA